jgi:undecaprenyl-diphosphatase
VVVSEKLMGLDPTSPEMTLLLVMLHTGTMFAVIVYFWKQWAKTYFQSAEAFKQIVILLFVATALTGIIGEGLNQSNREIRFPRRAERGSGTAFRPS